MKDVLGAEVSDFLKAEECLYEKQNLSGILRILENCIDVCV